MTTATEPLSEDDPLMCLEDDPVDDTVNVYEPREWLRAAARARTIRVVQADAAIQ